MTKPWGGPRVSAGSSGGYPYGDSGLRKVGLHLSGAVFVAEVCDHAVDACGVRDRLSSCGIRGFAGGQADSGGRPHVLVPVAVRAPYWKQVQPVALADEP